MRSHLPFRAIVLAAALSIPWTLEGQQVRAGPAVSYQSAASVGSLGVGGHLIASPFPFFPDLGVLASGTYNLLAICNITDCTGHEGEWSVHLGYRWTGGGGSSGFEAYAGAGATYRFASGVEDGDVSGARAEPGGFLLSITFSTLQRLRRFPDPFLEARLNIRDEDWAEVGGDVLLAFGFLLF